MEGMITRQISNQNGLSLVELLITISLLVVILSLGFLYLGFGVQAFEEGERRAIAQQAVRTTSDFITDELRFAKQIEINPVGGLTEAGFRYFFLRDGSIIFKSDDLYQPERILADSLADAMIYNIVFTSNVPDDVVIFTITADNDLYEITTRVQALNVGLFREFSYALYGRLIQVNAGDNTIIKYRKP
ncbi:MAG TPA: prepilin-type N-terminal cleavage/methylation domain-containing protein [Candidatus Limnocylindrales bacterium]|nr:prepilin-type N-terminal cleavage/methylation domain-containing protein [Candidatus Limnocylindrales bacterium]